MLEEFVIRKNDFVKSTTPSPTYREDRLGDDLVQPVDHLAIGRLLGKCYDDGVVPGHATERERRQGAVEDGRYRLRKAWLRADHQHLPREGIRAEADRRRDEPRGLSRDCVSLRHQGELIARLEGAGAHPLGSTQLREGGRERPLRDGDVTSSQ